MTSFMNGAGAAVKLRHEIESFNQATGALTVLGEPPLCFLQRRIRCSTWYYGNPGCINQEYPEKTWDSHYVAVWHMNDATSTTITDRTSNGITGMKKATNMPIEWSGMIGKGQKFDRTETIWEYITMNDLNKLRFQRLPSLHGYIH